MLHASNGSGHAWIENETQCLPKGFRAWISLQMVKTWGRDLLETAQVLVLGITTTGCENQDKFKAVYHKKWNIQNRWNLCHHVQVRAQLFNTTGCFRLPEFFINMFLTGAFCHSLAYFWWQEIEKTNIYNSLLLILGIFLVRRKRCIYFLYNRVSLGLGWFNG